MTSPAILEAEILRLQKELEGAQLWLAFLYNARCQLGDLGWTMFADYVRRTPDILSRDPCPSELP